MHQVTTLEVDARVRRCAHMLNDCTLIANLSAGDMIALEAKYHAVCLVSLYKKSAAFERNELYVDDADVSAKHSLAFAQLVQYICNAETAASPSATIVLAGDINSLDDTEVATRCALLSIVDRPTRGANILDRLYVNTPCYSTVRVLESTVKSDHKAVVAYS